MGNKLRFEVFKRDGFTCQYCGKTPPSAVLEVDHINPKSNNGETNLSNLITSCFECNRGKGKNKLTSIPPSIYETAKLKVERELQLVEYNKLLQLIDKRLDSSIRKFYRHMDNEGACEGKKEFNTRGLKTFFEHLPETEVIAAFDIAWEKLLENKRYNSYRLYKYFCGICWNKIKGTSPYEEGEDK
jgi:hypothetical protein